MPLGEWELRAWILEPHLWSYLLNPAFPFKPEFLSSSLTEAQWHSPDLSCLTTFHFIYKLIMPLGEWELLNLGARTSDHTFWLQHFPSNQNSLILKPDWSTVAFPWPQLLNNLSFHIQINYATGGMRAESLNLGATPLIIPFDSSISLQTRIP